MVNIGVNTFLWTTTWTDYKASRRLLTRIIKLGFNAIQIPILNLESFDIEKMHTLVSETGLSTIISAGLKPDMDITSDDPEERARGTEFLKGCVRIARRMGSPFLSGSFHSVFGKKAEGPVTARMWKNSSRCLKQVAKYATDNGLTLVLEPINRYESFLINTAGQVKNLIEMVGEPNVKVQLDTFHMSIEEENFHETIVSLGESLKHFHVAENHRGRFGKGTIPWDEVFKALSDIRYKGPIVIESFVPEVEEVAAAACIWRRMSPSADELAGEGLIFIKDLVRKYNL